VQQLDILFGGWAMIKIILVAVLSCVVGALAAIVVLEHPHQAISAPSPSIVTEAKKAVEESNNPSPVQVNNIILLPVKNIGDRCLRDGDCKSEECKKFRCVATNKTSAQIQGANDLSTKKIGEKCFRDEACKSGECKHFKCATRVKQIGDLGVRCAFDGDCKSEECKKFRCVNSENKSGYK